MSKVLEVWKLLALADMKDVPYRRNQQLSSCYAMKLSLVQQLLRGFSHGKLNKRLFTIILQRFISKIPAALYKQALALVATGQCAAALIPLNLAIALKHLPSRALLAHMLSGGRKDVPKDHGRAFKLVKEGTELGCHHCQGVMARCYRGGYGCVKNEARSFELARESSGKGSRYGQHVLGLFYRWGEGGVAREYAQAIALYRLAAAQNLDEAQCSLGLIYYYGRDVAQDYTEALRWYQLAAAQGHPWALFMVAECHDHGLGVRINKAEAIRWYRRAHKAGSSGGMCALQRLDALE